MAGEIEKNGNEMFETSYHLRSTNVADINTRISIENNDGIQTEIKLIPYPTDNNHETDPVTDIETDTDHVIHTTH